MRGRMKAVILELLQEYYRVEEAFQGEKNIDLDLVMMSVFKCYCGHPWDG